MSLKMNRLLEHSGQLSCIGNFLPDLVENSLGFVHVKDAQTGKYILSNYRVIKSLKLESMDDLIGLNINDIFSENGVYKKDLDISMLSWKNKEVERLNKLEYQAQCTKRPIRIRCSGYTIDGLLQFGNMVKLPIPDHSNKKLLPYLLALRI